MKNFPTEFRHGNGSMMLLDQTRLLLRFTQPQSAEELEKRLSELKLTIETLPKYINDDVPKPWHEINSSSQRYWVRTTDGSVITDDRFELIQKMFAETLEWIGPVYHMNRSSEAVHRLCPSPKTLVIEFQRSAQQEAEVYVQQLMKDYQLTEVYDKSKYLSGRHYFTINNLEQTNALQLRDSLKNREKKTVKNVFVETIPFLKPIASTIPNDTYWTSQWDMAQINAPAAWDISTGDSSVVICILDEGCDLTHPDLSFVNDGINLGTMMPTGAPTGNHGTSCAGIAAGSFNNAEGVSGVAGDCLILPLAFDTWSDVEVANGINYASANGAKVISMSFGWDPWDPAVIDPEIQNAFDNDVVMCVATHNHSSSITYPATNPLVIACGASSTDDNLKTGTSPDGECWGSDFGDIVYGGVTTGVSVVAPGVQCPSTDRQGSDGYNNNGTLTNNPWACVMYGAQPASGNYVLVFDGTSAATPHVAGLAGLIRSEYPSLTNVEVRNIIERTAAKTGTFAYNEMTGFANGTRNEEMGYGRIDAFHALDYADVLIKDWSGDDGTEPSTPPGNDFWDFSDIVVRITDDNVFNPSNPSQSKNVERGQANYIYVQVTNKGPREARNVNVECRITPWIGLQFRYPDDWTFMDAMHVRPTPVLNTFASVPSGGTVMAKFTISAAQTDTLYGWEYDNPWHPCLLASVVADNDYAFASAVFGADPLSQLKNNLAQRNLTVIDVLSSPGASAIAFPFVAGHWRNMEEQMTIVVKNPSPVKNIRLLLSLDDDGSAFPHVDFDQVNAGTGTIETTEGMVFTETTKVETTIGCCRGILTLVKGSRFDCIKETRIETGVIKGGELVLRNGKRYVAMFGNEMSVTLSKQPGAIYPLSVRAEINGAVEKGTELQITAAQQDIKGTTVGGASAIYYFK